MPRPRYEAEEEWYAGPRLRRAVLFIFVLAAILGLVLGVIWVAAGLWHFHGV